MFSLKSGIEIYSNHIMSYIDTRISNGFEISDRGSVYYELFWEKITLFLFVNQFIALIFSSLN